MFDEFPFHPVEHYLFSIYCFAIMNFWPWRERNVETTVWDVFGACVGILWPELQGGSEWPPDVYEFFGA